MRPSDGCAQTWAVGSSSSLLAILVSNAPVGYRPFRATVRIDGDSSCRDTGSIAASGNLLCMSGSTITNCVCVVPMKVRRGDPRAAFAAFILANECLQRVSAAKRIAVAQVFGDEFVMKIWIMPSAGTSRRYYGSNRAQGKTTDDSAAPRIRNSAPVAKGKGGRFD
jgi:hypothetical protein